MVYHTKLNSLVLTSPVLLTIVCLLESFQMAINQTILHKHSASSEISYLAKFQLTMITLLLDMDLFALKIKKVLMKLSDQLNTKIKSEGLSMHQEQKEKSEKFTTTFLLRTCQRNGTKVKLEKPFKYSVILHQWLLNQTKKVYMQ